MKRPKLYANGKYADIDLKYAILRQIKRSGLGLKQVRAELRGISKMLPAEYALGILKDRWAVMSK